MSYIVGRNIFVHNYHAHWNVKGKTQTTLMQITVYILRSIITLFVNNIATE